MPVTFGSTVRSSCTKASCGSRCHTSPLGKTWSKYFPVMPMKRLRSGVGKSSARSALACWLASAVKVSCKSSSNACW